MKFYLLLFRYNRALSGTRVRVEQVFGRWKRRFSALHRELRIELDRVPTFIVACAVLHNIAIDFYEPEPDSDSDDSEEDSDEEDQPPQPSPQQNQTGNRVRQNIVNAYFTR